MDPFSILIVEDEAIVALDLKLELESLGYTVVGIADTAVQAVNMARRYAPSLTLMDIMLKGDVDGIQAAEALHRDLNAPVVFLTSFSDAETVTRAARTGAYGYLTKPFQVKELRAGIEVALWKAQMERQLHDSDRWFASTLRCVQDGVVVVDADGGVRFLNTAAERLLGWPSGDAAGRFVSEVVRYDQGADDGNDEAARGERRTLVLRSLEEGRVFGIRHGRALVCRGGGTVAVDESAGPIFDGQGRRLGAVLVLRDARERLRQEALLRDSEERFRTAFEFAPLGMALVSLDGSFLQVNEALCRLLQRTPEQLLKWPQASITHPDDVDRERDQLAGLEDGSQRVAQFEKRCFCGGSGEAVAVRVNATLLRDGAEASCLMFVFHDLTAQRAATARLAELATERIKREASELASRTKSEFLSRVSHEMRTPLNAVLGFAELLKMKKSGSTSFENDYSEHILNAGKHLLALVDDVLDLQRAGDHTLHLRRLPVEVDDVMPASMQLLMPMAGTHDVRLVSGVAPGLVLLADATRLRQVLLNVGSNAIKYNARGGSVRFTAERIDGGRVRLGVADTGIGMSAEQLEHLFEPFNRLGREALRVPGVGLGLVITKKLIEEMGGSLAITGGADGGTLVAIEFDAVEQHAAASTRDAAETWPHSAPDRWISHSGIA